MKITNEFANNSSSSSFAIKGYKIVFDKHKCKNCDDLHDIYDIFYEIAADNSDDERLDGCIKRYGYGMYAGMVEC